MQTLNDLKPESVGRDIYLALASSPTGSPKRVRTCGIFTFDEQWNVASRCTGKPTARRGRGRWFGEASNTQETNTTSFSNNTPSSAVNSTIITPLPLKASTPAHFLADVPARAASMILGQASNRGGRGLARTVNSSTENLPWDQFLRVMDRAAANILRHAPRLSCPHEHARQAVWSGMSPP